jgi:ABC-type nitrate/sulfonate/bicarbonate transport system substrate-binding protein
MSFWVAKYGGLFEREGIDVELVFPASPKQAETMFESGAAESGVLAPPMYLRFIAAKVPLVLVANLLRNDPIDLIVRKDVAEKRHLDAKLPLKERLTGLRGLRLGIAPHPPTRLRALFASEGLDVDKDLTLEILHGPEQNAAFTEGRVDALYAHTPYLEKAIVQDSAVMLVEQTRGEIPGLANRQIHCFTFRASVAKARPEVVLAAIRAIGAAEKSIHTSQKDTVDVLARAFPTRDRRELETIVRLYEPAIPDAPDVHIEDIAPAIALFPDGLPKPDLSAIDLKQYIATDLAPQARAAAPAADSSAKARSIVIAVAIATVLAIVVGTLTARKETAPKP